MINKSVYVKIGEAAKYIGRSTQTMRRYDKEGVLKPDNVSETGIRYYKISDLDDFIDVGRRFRVKANTSSMPTILRRLFVTTEPPQDDLYFQDTSTSQGDLGDMIIPRVQYSQQTRPTFNVIPIDRRPAIYARVAYAEDIDSVQAKLNEQMEILLDQATSDTGLQREDIHLFGDIGSGILFDNKGFVTLLDKIQENSISYVYILSNERISRFAFPIVERLANVFDTKIISLYPNRIDPQEANEDCADAISEINRLASLTE